MATHQIQCIHIQHMYLHGFDNRRVTPRYTLPHQFEVTPQTKFFCEDLDEDYESASQFVGPNGSPLIIITGEDDNSRAPSSVLEHGAADTLTALRTSPDVTSTAEVITNPLDEQQQQQVALEERAKRRSETLVHLAEQKD